MTYSMEPSIEVYHLGEYSRELQCHLITVDVMIRQILQVVNSASLNKFHHKHSLSRIKDLCCIPGLVILKCQGIER